MLIFRPARLGALGWSILDRILGRIFGRSLRCTIAAHGAPGVGSLLRGNVAERLLVGLIRLFFVPDLFFGLSRGFPSLGNRRLALAVSRPGQQCDDGYR